jgi:hypothetical protein
MRKYTLFILLIALLLTVTCSKKYTWLNLQIGKQPEGGKNVTEVLAIILARLEDGDTPIQTDIEWWWKDENGEDEQLYWHQLWTFRDESWWEIPVSIVAPEGYVLVGYFWFRVTWTDEDGTENEVLSEEAYCYQ